MSDTGCVSDKVTEGSVRLLLDSKDEFLQMIGKDLVEDEAIPSEDNVVDLLVFLSLTSYACKILKMDELQKVYNRRVDLLYTVMSGLGKPTHSRKITTWRGRIRSKLDNITEYLMRDSVRCETERKLRAFSKEKSVKHD